MGLTNGSSPLWLCSMFARYPEAIMRIEFISSDPTLGWEVSPARRLTIFLLWWRFHLS